MAQITPIAPCKTVVVASSPRETDMLLGKSYSADEDEQDGIEVDSTSYRSDPVKGFAGPKIAETTVIDPDSKLQAPTLMQILAKIHSPRRVAGSVEMEVFMNWLQMSQHKAIVMSLEADGLQEILGKKRLPFEVEGGFTLLHTLVKRDQYPLIKKVMDAAQKRKIVINSIIEDNNMNTPLSIACKTKNNRVVNRLMMYFRLNMIWMGRRDLCLIARYFSSYLSLYFKEMDLAPPTIPGGGSPTPWLPSERGCDVSQDCRRYPLRVGVNGNLELEVCGSSKMAPFHEGLWTAQCAQLKGEQKKSWIVQKWEELKNLEIKAFFLPATRMDAHVRAHVIGIPNMCSAVEHSKEEWQDPKKVGRTTGSGVKSSLLKELYMCGNQQLFATKTIMALLDFKWKTYGGWRYRRDLILYMLYTAFFAYSTNHFANLDSVLIWDEPGSVRVRETQDQGLGTVITHIILILFSLYYLICEVVSVKIQGMTYYLSVNNVFYNIAELSCFVFVITALVLNEIQGYQLEANLVAALASVQVYGNVFLRLRCFEATGPFISMVKAIIMDMGYFLILAFVSIFAFAQAFHVLMNKTQGNPLDSTGRYESLSDWVYTTYLMMLGEFATTIGYFDNGYSNEYPFVPHCFFIVFTVLIQLIELNLLIAIMGGTLGRVLEDGTDDDWRFEQAGVLVNIEDSMSESERENGKYFPTWIHILAPSDVTTDEEEKQEHDEYVLETLQEMLGDVQVMLRLHEKATRKMVTEFDQKCDLLEEETMKLRVLKQSMGRM